MEVFTVTLTVVLALATAARGWFTSTPP